MLDDKALNRKIDLTVRGENSTAVSKLDDMRKDLVVYEDCIIQHREVVLPSGNCVSDLKHQRSGALRRPEQSARRL